MSRTPPRRLAAVLLVAFLLSLLPPARPLAAQTDDLLTMDVVPALPEPPALAAPSIPVFEPLGVPLLPGLALDVTLADRLPVVGTTLTVTLLIANRATHPADAVVLTMPLPAGTAAADPLDPAWNGTHWQWELGQLAAETTIMHAVAVTLVAQVGNVTRILDQRLNSAQRFRYDHRDWLTHASALDGSSNSISIQARGTDADGWPLMRLRVNGTTVKEWTVGSTSWATSSHTLATPVSDADTVDVEFVNDDASGGANRDLFVQTITVGNQVIPATARTVSDDRGAVDGQDVVASDGKMWWNGALRLTERFSYDALGNLTTKANLAMTYGATGNGPHQVRTVGVGGVSFSYDSNGNLTSGGGRSLSWTPTNMPASITSGGVTETYAYTGDGERYRRVRGSVTTLFLEGIYEETVGGAVRRYYTLNGQVVALRERSGTVTTTSYPHGDHLGSVSLVSTSSGALASQQEYDAWGQVRLLPNQTQLPIQQTGRNYTGQERDGTGLLYDTARYYDPAIGRFLSADTVVPGSASGGMDGVAVKPLTVSFAETPFLTKLNQEHQFDFWYHLSTQERQQVGSPWGPANPQALNRYSYVLNNPLRYTDPSGHEPGERSANGYSYKHVRGIEGENYSVNGYDYVVDAETGYLYRDTVDGPQFLMQTCINSGTDCKYTDSASTQFGQFKSAVDNMDFNAKSLVTGVITGTVGGCAGGAIAGGVIGGGPAIPGCIIGGLVGGVGGGIVSFIFSNMYWGDEASRAYGSIKSLGAPRRRN